MSAPRTRLAPSPTGALHLGNARTFLINWALARQRGWAITLRIEDLDTPRTKPGADQQAIADLHWLGLDYDAGPTWQKADLAPYESALAHLASRGLIYHCRCTRSQIEAAAAASAPHADDHELRYPGTCRPDPLIPIAYRPITDDEPGCFRLAVPDESIPFTDELAGPQSLNLHRHVGDFIVATRAGLPAYQLAVVIDDARAGVTHIVRGDDLIASTPRQLLLYRLLALSPVPRYLHLPLVVGPDGRRLAKRHGDTRLSHYRDHGVPADRIIGLLAEWSGIGPRRPMSAAEFADQFDLSRLPRQRAVMTPEDDRWLLQST
jgi:glutamyl-tRNA synthetase